MKRNLFSSLFVLLPFLAATQTVNFEVLPFINGTTSVKDGQIEAGPELNWEKVNAFTLTVKPFVRVPLTNKSDNVLQIDRFSSTWRGIMAIEFTRDFTQANGPMRRHSFVGQFEYGSAAFKYYPTADKLEEQKTTKTSYGFELKWISFFSPGLNGAKQYSHQMRFRYSYDWKSSSEVGVVNPPNSNGVVTTSNMVISAPNATPIFSPAYSLQFYPGSGNFSYSPTIYYDFTGKKGANSPFGSLNRLRVEFWTFFYPMQQGNPNVKIGVSPFISAKIAGADDFNKLEYGGMITVKFGTSFLQFF